jgi:hypothetical protein
MNTTLSDSPSPLPIEVSFAIRHFQRQITGISVWNNIKDEMFDYMEQMKAWRLVQERLALLQDRRRIAMTVWATYRRENPSTDIIPNVPDFWEQEDIKATIQLPSNIDVDEISFCEFTNRMPAWIDMWREDKKLDILHGARFDHLPWPRTTESREAHLKLAVYVFTCSKYLCFKNEEEEEFDNWKYYPMFYPEYLHHRCNRIRRINWLDKNEDGGGPDNHLLRLGAGYPPHTQCQAWSSGELTFDDKASKVVRKIIEACGWDWRIMAASEMDNRDPRIVCLKCTYGHECDGERIVTVMTWKKAVRVRYSLMRLSGR